MFSGEVNVGGHPLTLETGRLARQANGSVVVRYGDTMVLVTACYAPGEREGIDFLPLTVDYRENTYASGRIPGGFFKREGKPPEKEVLTSRLIDRPIRPLFPAGWRREIAGGGLRHLGRHRQRLGRAGPDRRLGRPRGLRDSDGGDHRRGPGRHARRPDHHQPDLRPAAAGPAGSRGGGQPGRPRHGRSGGAATVGSGNDRRAGRRPRGHPRHHRRDRQAGRGRRQGEARTSRRRRRRRSW